MDVDSLLFTKEHEWVSFDEKSNHVTIGITDFAAGELGDIVFIELPEVGSDVKQSDSIGTIEAVKTVADLYAPVSGTVEEVNAKLQDNPELVNQSPFDSGWFVKIRLSDQSELKALMSKSEYGAMVGKES